MQDTSYPWNVLISSEGRKQRKKVLEKIRSGAYEAILLSPPCSTFTRAVWANFKGPRPVRSYEKPRGLDNLTAAERDKAILGNIFADFCWDIIMATLEIELAFLLLEQSEDLGAMRYGPHAGSPAMSSESQDSFLCATRKVAGCKGPTATQPPSGDSLQGTHRRCPQLQLLACPGIPF